MSAPNEKYAHKFWIVLVSTTMSEIHTILDQNGFIVTSGDGVMIIEKVEDGL